MKKTLILTCLTMASSLLAQEFEMKPFPIDWKGLSGGEADVSFLLEAPAGKNGFIQVRNGHLAKPDGERFRIWGTNLGGPDCTPSKQRAKLVAAQLARYGMNCVRMHYIDQPAPAGLIRVDRNDTSALDPELMDRFDFFIAELKKRGIYVGLWLNIARLYKPGDGVLDYEYLGSGKSLKYFDEHLRKIQWEYARQLLTHYNPYTKSEYRNEPAVLMIELVNEDSIVESWIGNRLAGKNTRKYLTDDWVPGFWTDITANYANTLTERYNAWLGRTLPPSQLERLRKAAGVPPTAPVPRLRREEFAGAPAIRFYTEAQFYMSLEDAYYQSMRSFLREELDVKSLLVATSDHNHTLSGYALLKSASRLDIVDSHDYWQHQRHRGNPVDGRRGFEIVNTPMVNDPLHSIVVELSRSAYAGKPFTVSEANHPFPSEYACEGFPILTAYGGFQDWDGIFSFGTGADRPIGDREAPPTFQRGHMEVLSDPVKMAETAAGALMFLRGDVSPAKETIMRSYSKEQVYESLRLPRSEGPYFTPGFPLTLPLQHAMRIASLDGKPTAGYRASPSTPIVSDTKELSWHYTPGNTGLITVDTPRSQALIGFVRSNRKVLRNLSADVDNNFCAIILSAMDRKPLSRSEKMLLTTGARVANTGMKWNEQRTSLTAWGGAPTLIEVVKGAVTLRNLEGAAKLEVLALDSNGLPLAAAISGRRTTLGWEIPIGNPATTWYVIKVQH